MDSDIKKILGNQTDFRFESGIYDFLHNKRFNPYDLSEIELDYHWDFTEDPIITPTIIHEWDYLDKVISKRVTKDAETVLSIGGGGTSRTHKNLTEKTKILVVHNPGVWDLANYPATYGSAVIFKVRGIGEVLPYLTQSFDAIEIPATLDHVVDPTRVIAEAFRVLRPAGKVGITLGNNRSWYRRIVSLFRVKINDHHEHAHNFHFSSEEIEELLLLAGFINVVTHGSAFLKLPKYFERKIRTTRALTLHRFVSTHLLSRILPANSGGMFVVTGTKP